MKELDCRTMKKNNKTIMLRRLSGVGHFKLTNPFPSYMWCRGDRCLQKVRKSSSSILIGPNVRIWAEIFLRYVKRRAPFCQSSSLFNSNFSIPYADHLSVRTPPGFLNIVGRFCQRSSLQLPNLDEEPHTLKS